MRRHLTFANAVSLLALFVALGGSSYAALKVGSKQIRNNSVRTADLRNNDIRGKDVRTGGLDGSDVNDDSLKGGDVDESSLATVPSAAVATSATNAANATSLGGTPASAFARAGEPIPSGVTVRGVWSYQDRPNATTFGLLNVSLPAPASAALGDADVNFAPTFTMVSGDETSACSGTYAEPTAPPGKVCIYPLALGSGTDGALGVAAGALGSASRFGFGIFFQQLGSGADVGGNGSWAYTAP